MTAALAPRELRSYQVEAREAVFAQWGQEIRRTSVILPTGTGKSSVIATIAATCYRMGMRVVLLAHRGELLAQMLDNVRAVDPAIPESELGVVKAEQDDHHAAIVAASFQTLAGAHRRQALGKRDVILVDETHHVGAEGYHATVADLGGYDGAFLCGFTATMYRDKGSRGGVALGQVIQSIAYEKDLRWAIDEGYLVQPRGLTVRIAGLDKLNDIRTVAGDFQQTELAEVMEAATDYVVEAVSKHAADRRAIVFAAGVDAAYVLAEAMTAAGLAAEVVVGATPDEDRQAVYDRFRAGTTRFLVTVQVLTEGADFPMCDAVVLARPTRSRNLYTQMVGRALRLYPGKTDALVLDLSGSARHMKLVNLSQLDAKAPRQAVDEDGEVVDLGDEIPAEEPVERVRKIRQGPVEMVSVDLLNGSSTLWLETPDGVPFIPAREVLGFVIPLDAGGYRPGFLVPKTGQGAFASDFDELTDALAEAEKLVAEHDETGLPQTGASWRRSQAPSTQQLRMASHLGIPMAEDMTKARLSDEISIAKSTKILRQVAAKANA
ncbi:helicase [Tsukamurella phage TPA2]|uniref:helicase n=1 Tax=Tsukamurella phage TPA2 TaxID=981330 RepID=UPI0001FF8DD1|nr:helicase [Tsukamurella phage TPA2]ADX31972.1 helicase [Tsukamurella phage TPA2]